MRPAVGVLALQGGVREHLAALSSLGAAPFAVRRPDELARCEALVLPGGESTAISRLLRRCELLEPLRARVADGLPVLGTCAGMVLLADRLADGVDGVEGVGGLDVTVRRNAFGRQVDSFEADLQVAGLDATVPAVFIRAPWVEECGPGVEVLASVGGRPVLVRGGAVLAASFHPELTGDTAVHALLLDLLAGPSGPGPHL